MARLPAILQHITAAIPRYSKRALRALYECMRALATVMPSELAKPEVLAQLLNPLVARWQALGPMDLEQVPLMECVSGIAVAAGQQVEHYAMAIFTRWGSGRGGAVCGGVSVLW